MASAREIPEFQTVGSSQQSTNTEQPPLASDTSSHADRTSHVQSNSASKTRTTSDMEPNVSENVAHPSESGAKGGALMPSCLETEENEPDDTSANSSESGLYHFSLANGNESENSSSLTSTSFSESSVSSESITFVEAESHGLCDYNRPGPKVRVSCVRKTGVAVADVAEVIERVSKAKTAREQRQHIKNLQSSVLPKLAQKRSLQGIAKCMVVDDIEVQRTAATLLQTKLMQLTYRKDPKLTDELLSVAESTHAAFNQSSDKDAHAHLLGLLHLVVLSALLTRCPKPSEEQCRALLFSSDRAVKQKGLQLTDKRKVLEALSVFSETFMACLQTTSFPAWRNDEMTSNAKNMFKKASVTERLTYAYTLVNEIATHPKSDFSMRLVGTLSELKEIVHKHLKDAKRMEESVRFAFDLLLVSGLTFLLNTTFKEASIPVGASAYNHTSAIVDLIIDVLEKGARRPGSDRLEQETLILPFHNASLVRTTFSRFLKKQSEVDTAIAYVKTHLQKYGFRPTPYQLGIEDAFRGCDWWELECTFEDKDARLVMLARKHDCLAEDPNPKMCMKGHFGKNKKRTSQIKTEHRIASEKARNNKHNLDMLLHLSHECKHLLSMYTFQFSPFPFFITEAVGNRRLLNFLLDHREARKWLKRDVLLKILCDIVEALRFFKQKQIVLRNITCFNILVKATRRQQPFLDILPSGSFIVKVVDLGQAHHTTDPVYAYPSVLKVAVENQGQIPTRWTPQEALLDGSYSDKSEMYSLGCAAFEMFTHGNQPFSSYDYFFTTEELILKLLQEPRAVRLHHFPCIPNDVFNLISRLTDSDIDGRPQSLDAVATELNNLRKEQDGNEDVYTTIGLEVATNYPMMYQKLSQQQLERQNEPETGIPPAVQRFIENGVPENTRNKRSDSGTCEVKKKELQPRDSITIEHKDWETIVVEKVTENWRVNVLPALVANDPLEGVTCWTSQRMIDSQHERHYKRCIDLISAAKSDLFWNNSRFSSDQGYGGACSPDLSGRCYQVLHSLTLRLMMLHEHGFCHGDLRAANILIDRESGEVVFPRIGRTCRLPSPGVNVNIDIFEDSLRWVAPEVALSWAYGHSVCSQAADVYSLGTTVYEMYNIRDVCASNPAAEERHFAPFSSYPKNEVLTESRPERSLQKPKGCLDWMYDLICWCRHRDHAERPSCQDVLEVLRVHRDPGVLPTPFWPDPSSSERAGAYAMHPSNYTDIEERGFRMYSVNNPVEESVYESVGNLVEYRQIGSTYNNQGLARGYSMTAIDEEARRLRSSHNLFGMRRFSILRTRPPARSSRGTGAGSERPPTPPPDYVQG